MALPSVRRRMPRGPSSRTARALLAVAAAAALYTAVPAEDESEPADYAACIRMTFERRYAAHAELFRPEDNKKLELFFRIMEGQCREQRFDEALLTAQSVDVLIGVFRNISHERFSPPPRLILPRPKTAPAEAAPAPPPPDATETP